MENITINNRPNDKIETLNHKIMIGNREHIAISGISKMLSSNDSTITMLIKTTKLIVNGKNLHIEKLDVENGLLEASGTIDCVKYSGNEGFVKRIFK